MEIIFYNIVAIVIGLLLAYYGSISMIKRKKILFGGLTIGVSVFFIGFGVGGFFFPDDHSYIVILSILAFTLIEIIFFLLFNKKEDDKKKPKKALKGEAKDSDYLEEKE